MYLFYSWASQLHFLENEIAHGCGKILQANISGLIIKFIPEKLCTSAKESFSQKII